MPIVVNVEQGVSRIGNRRASGFGTDLLKSFPSLPCGLLEGIQFKAIDVYSRTIRWANEGEMQAINEE